MPGDNDDNTVVALASIPTSSGGTVAAAAGGTVAAAAVATLVEAATYGRGIGGRR